MRHCSIAAFESVPDPPAYTNIECSPNWTRKLVAMLTGVVATMQALTHAAVIIAISEDATQEAVVRGQFEAAKAQAAGLELPVRQGPKDSWLLGDTCPVADGLDACLAALAGLLATR